MKRLVTVFFFLHLASFASDPPIAYFTRARSVTVSAPDRQNYLIIDADVWQYARADLADLRLYDGSSPVPYALATRSGDVSSQEIAVKILNLGSTAGHTEFDLEISGVNKYDRVRLKLDARNFINNARVEGRQTLTDRSGPNLGSATLYDFSDENLGSNSVVKFPTASFPYLHIRLAPGIRPSAVTGALVSNVAETMAAWAPAGTCPRSSGPAHQTTFSCSILSGVPAERIAFALPDSTANFNRTVRVSGDNGEFARGAISRVRVNRGGRTVVSENLSLDLDSEPHRRITVAIENGDDVPLPVVQVQLLSFERRVYFDPQGKTRLRLYYGDPKLRAASYDYQKLFQESPDDALAQLGPAEANARFTRRPDDRPWSERHTALLWTAMLIAVVVLGALALRGLKANALRS
jgi:hypothetical protein